MNIHRKIPNDSFIKSEKKHLIIIPCCKRKRTDKTCNQVNATYFFDVNNGVEILNLNNNRENVLQQHPESIINPNIFTKAWDLYDGQLYRKLKQNQNVIDDKIRTGKIEIIIISALYGVVNYDSCINKYDLKMQQTRVQWGTVIRNAIVQYIYDKNIDTIHSFLTPSTYHLAATNDIELNIRHRAYWADLVEGNPTGGNNNVYNSVADKIIQIIENIN